MSEITRDLIYQQCESCVVDAPKLDQAALKALSSQIPDWQVETVEGVMQLCKDFSFKNFVTAMVFAGKVGQLAERHSHHPKITVEWGRVQVAWWTHKINGIHHNDAILAAKTDALF